MQTPNPFLDTLYVLAKKERRFRLFGRLISMLTIVVILWLSAALTDNLFHFSRLNRWGFFIVGLLIIAYLLIHFVGQPFVNLLRLKRSTDLSTFALALGHLVPDRPDTFINAYQLIRETEIVTAIKHAAVEQLLSEVDWDKVHQSVRLRSFLPGISLVLPTFIAIIVLASINFNGLLNSTYRLLDPAHDYLQIPFYSFTVLPGDAYAFSGAPLEIKIGYVGPPAEKLFLEITNSDSSRSQRLLQKQDNYYIGRLKTVRQSFGYRVSVRPMENPELEGKIISQRYRIFMRTLPDVKELDVTVVPPAYSGLQPERPRAQSGNVDALKGSRARIEIASSKALKKAWLIFSDSSRVSLLVRGRRAMGSFQVLRSQHYKIYLLDTDSLQNREQIDYKISVYSDAAPLVEISKPGADIEIQPDAQVPLQIDAADDYGLSSAVLMYRYLKKIPDADSTWKSYHLPALQKHRRTATIQTVLDLNGFYIAFGDELEYYARVADNNAIDGSQFGRSAVYRFIFPSLDALFNDFAQKEDASVDKMEKTVHGAGDLKKEIEKIRRDLKRTEKMDWAKKKALQDVLKKQEAIQKNIEKIRQDMEKMVDKLDQNNLMSEEILQKYNKLQDMFNELATPELLKAMQKLQSAIEKDNVKQAEKALEEFKLNQETFLEQIERTLELFKQVQLEQQLERLVEQAEYLAKTQEQISKTLKNQAKNNDGIKESLKQQSAKQAALERNLEETLKNKKLNDFDKAREELQKTSEQAEQQNMTRRLQKMAAQISAGEQKESSRQSGQMQQQMAQQQQQLSSAMRDIRDANKKQIQREMALAARKLLKLSRAQEKLGRETRGASNVNEQLQKLGREQDQIQQNLKKVISKIVGLSRKTFFMEPALSSHLRSASREMENSLRGLSERQTAQASGAQIKAMAALNRSAQAMQKSMQNMKGSQSGTGFAEFMKKMEQMAGAQGGVNSGTMQLFGQQGKGGQEGMKSGGNGQRLAARQKAIQQAMEQMAGEQAGRRDMLGRLSKMGQDMDEIIQDLLNNKVTRKTIQRQQQIMTRMLDAQKSAQTRKLSKKRRAVKPGSFQPKDPKKLATYEKEQLKKLMDAMRRIPQQGFSGDYEKLIKAYYKSLLSRQQKQGGPKGD